MSEEQGVATRPRVTVLATKLQIPQPRPSLVARQRLVARLTGALAVPLTLISAPAGFGKTTLVSEWIAQLRGLPVAWLSLDDDDNDPARFLAYLISALDTLKPGIGVPALELLALPQLPPWKTILTTLLNSLGVMHGDFVLVLDDYHVLTEPAIHAALGYLLEHAPANMHLVVAGRADPPLPLARLRARGQLLELRQADLRFTSQEAAAFLSQTMKLALSREDMAALHVETEGWIAGLQMAALCLAAPGTPEQEQPAGFIAAFSGSNRFILDYLIEEVLARQPAHIQRFLLHTAILEQLSGPLCAAVLDESQNGAAAQAILEDLERSNLFTVPLDHERRWYRYHHLFADFLRVRLRGTEPGILPVLHRRAAAWYEYHGLAHEAVGHALDGADWGEAARLIEGTAQDVLMRGQVATLIGWLEALPEEALRVRPRLPVFYAFALLITGEYAAAERQLDAAEGALALAAKEGAERASLDAQIAAGRVMVAFYTGSDTARQMETALGLLQNLPQDNPLARGIAALVAGLASFMHGDLDTANQALDESIAASQATGGYPLIAQVAIYTAGLEQMMRGHLRRAAEIFDRGLRLLPVATDADPPPVACLVYQALGELLRERDDLDTAERYLVRSAALGERLRSPDMLADGAFTLARLRQARGDRAGALAVIGSVTQQAREGRLMALTGRLAMAHEARIHIAQGDLAAAGRWSAGLEEARRATQSWQWSGAVALMVDGIEDTVLARCRLAEGKYDQAAGLVRDVLQRATSSGWTGLTLEALALLALAEEGEAHHAQAIATLHASLVLAEPEGYARIYLDEGAAMAALLRRMRDEGGRAKLEGPIGAYVDRLLAAWVRPAQPDTARQQAEAHVRAQSSPQPVVEPRRLAAPQTLVEPLSDREREVLALLAAGLSTGEIASRLVISEGTVKRHINNIHQKLDVHSRVQAIARARELHIL